MGERSKKQIIFEAETLCAVLAFSLWSKFFSGKKSFLYVDNEGTKFSLIKGKSENAVVDAISHIFAEIETHVKSLCWVSRVSSHSNIADGPSRGDIQLLKKLQFEDVSLEATACLKVLCESVKSKLGKTADPNNPSCKT